MMSWCFQFLLDLLWIPIVAYFKTDLLCMSLGFLCFAVNLVWPKALWAIFIMSAGGGMTFVRAHLSVHGKMAAGASIENLSLAAKWSGAARNAGTVCAFVVPVLLYTHVGWRAVV